MPKRKPKKSHTEDDEKEHQRQRLNLPKRVKYSEDQYKDPSSEDSRQIAILESHQMLMSTISQHNRDAIQTIHQSTESSKQAATAATLQIMSALQNPTASRSAVQAPRAVAYRKVISLVDSDNEKEECEIIDLIDSDDDDNTADYPCRGSKTNQFVDSDQGALLVENTFFEGDNIKVPTKALIQKEEGGPGAGGPTASGNRQQSHLLAAPSSVVVASDGVPGPSATRHPFRSYHAAGFTMYKCMMDEVLKQNAAWFYMMPVRVEIQGKLRLGGFLMGPNNIPGQWDILAPNWPVPGQCYKGTFEERFLAPSRNPHFGAVERYLRQSGYVSDEWMRN